MRDTSSSIIGPGLNMFMMWWICCITNTEQTSENMYLIHLWHTKCSTLAEVRWPFGTWCMWCVRSFFIVYKNLLAKFIQGFPYWGDGGVRPNNQKFTQSTPPHQIFIPSHQKSIQSNKKIKTSFLAVVIAPVPFLF